MLVGLLAPIVLFAATGTIDPANSYSRLCQNSDCSQFSVVNWHPTNSTVTVTDTGLTGYIWSANLGWINLWPATARSIASTAGVSNTTAGILSGYAWGEDGSWVNFKPDFGGNSAYHGVQIDPTTGEFSGWAWVQNSGWMLFDCSQADACVKTTWRGTTDTTTTTTTTTDSGNGGNGAAAGGGDSGTGGDTGSTGTGDSGTGDSGTGTTGGDTGSTGDTGGSTSTGGGTTGGATSGGAASGGSSSAGGGHGTTVVPTTTSTPLTPFVPPYIVVGHQITVATQNVRQAVNSTAGVAVTRTVGVVGVVGGTAVSVTAGILLNPMSIYDFLLIPIRLWSLLLGAVGLAKRKKPWGTVYDAVTKQPLDPAYVVLRSSEGVDVATAITDLDGRYGFVAPAPGTYTLVANKTNYAFPSLKLVGHDHDELYRDLYFGEHFTIATAGEVVTRNIPMDPLKFDWNEFAKRDQNLLRFYSRREKWLLRLSNVFFYLGFAVSSVAVLLSMTKYNIIVFCLYIVLFFVRKFGLKARPFGRVVSIETGDPVPFAIIRVTQASTHVEVMHRVADQFGRYYALLPNGDYVIRIDQKLPDATYKTVGTGLAAKVTKGYLSAAFTVSTGKPEELKQTPPPSVPPALPPTPPALTPAPAAPTQPQPAAPAVPEKPAAISPVVSNPDYSE